MRKRTFAGWNAVAEKLMGLADHVINAESSASEALTLRDGQAESLRVLADRIPKNGMLIADEVGMGKTLLACLLARCVSECGGRIAIVIPPNLGYQWQEELRRFNPGSSAKFVRSLGEFFSAWPKEQNDHEWQQKAWFDESVILLPHGFSNWRIGNNSAHWRWALPAMMHAHLRKQGESNRYPREFLKFAEEVPWSVYHAADSIVNYHIEKNDKNCKIILDNLADPEQWTYLKSADQFSSGREQRDLLTKSVGLGLGQFDLVIIDEAHKSRGYDSKLSQLLDNVILTNPDSRRIAMTATPVELDSSQWQEMLQRIGVSGDVNIIDTVQHYIDAVNQVKRTPECVQATETFGKAAKEFQAALEPYVIRRDKRNTKAIQSFIEAKGGSAYDYLKREEIAIEVKDLPNEWKAIVCASEALSLVANDDISLKRLRLTVANGHGITSLCDSLKSCDQDSEVDISDTHSDDANPTDAKITSLDTPVALSKKQQRAQWWAELINRHLDKSDSDLFNHPHIQATIKKIEELTGAGEKVLVFGRFTNPMNALTRLLNARAMLRIVCSDTQHEFWPQSKVHEADIDTVKAALKQLNLGKTLQEVNDKLDAQYRQLEEQRKSVRDSMIDELRSAIAYANPSEKEHLSSLLDCIARDTDADNLRALFHAMQDLKVSDTPQGLLETFKEIIASVYSNTDNEQDIETSGSDYADKRWQYIAAQLRIDFTHHQSVFARLMNGNTSMSSRQLMKVGFNRESVNPRVLVAQSMVGREGLNLHKACRHVVLFHPEWNPGVVEQQIGRVDRFESRWEKLLEKALKDGKSGDQLPRIHVHCVMFQETYDEQHWKILNQRWDELRAQLHGVILSPEDEPYKIAINDMAPSFSPIQRAQR